MALIEDFDKAPLRWPWRGERYKPGHSWRVWAQSLAQWIKLQQLDVRRVKVVLPLAGHIVLARQAWVETAGGWHPIFDFAQNVFTYQGQAAGGLAGCVTGDKVVDRLQARMLLAGYSWAQAWATADARGFLHLLEHLCELTYQFLRAVRGFSAPERLAYWQSARQLLNVGAMSTTLAQVGAQERLLALVALEWAAQSAEVLDQDGAVGGGDIVGWVITTWQPLKFTEQNWLKRQERLGRSVLWLLADIEPGVDAAVPPVNTVECRSTLDFEDEAQWVVERLGALIASRQSDEEPIALIAQDRSLVRRVRVLLERSSVRVADETGWKLSTTRAAAALMSVLRLAGPNARCEEVLDGLISGWLDLDLLLASFGDRDAAKPWRPADMERGLFHLGQQLAQSHLVAAWSQAGSLGPDLDGMAQCLWQAAQRLAGALRGGGGCSSLLSFVQRLYSVLQQCGLWQALSVDEAGVQLLKVLRLGPAVAAGDEAWQRVAANLELDWSGLLAWVEDALECAVFMPARPADPQIVITPLQQAVLRPFSAVVLAGGDERHLAQVNVAPMWVSVQTAEVLGLPTRKQLRAEQWQAFNLLLSHPQVVLSWRVQDDGQPVGPSPLLERWAMQQGYTDWAKGAERGVYRCVATPIYAPLPQLRAEVWMPAEIRLNASAYERLRSCPYWFYAERLLRLGVPEEFDGLANKRDYGTWLHAILQRYHEQVSMAQRLSAAEQETELARLRKIAEQVSVEQGWGGVDQQVAFLPFQVAFQRLAQAYLDWWVGQADVGVQVAYQEKLLRLAGEEFSALGVNLSGQLDRVDGVRSAAQADSNNVGRVWRIVDYKTTPKAALQAKVRVPTEDTQLAFYAALLSGFLATDQEAYSLEAGYLSLDERQVTWVAHPQVHSTSEALLAGLHDDLVRIRQGHVMPALGQGSVCEYCAMRGLCRRDHWSERAEPFALAEHESAA